jgi:glutamate N-acetyltransferase/amino-acid N-acetyltransferase
MEDTLESAQKVASVLGLDDLNDVLIESTGVIGKRIKMPELMKAVPLLAANLSSSAAAAAAAATAICTTDLARKSVAVSVPLPDGRVVKVGGMGKGSGMIHPNMATMLGVVTCDAPVEVNAWRAMTKRACQNSYNQISVDGDTSTNDTVIALSSGAAGGDIIEAGSECAVALEAALTAVHVAIAKSIAWDGEGATVLLECNVARRLKRIRRASDRAQRGVLQLWPSPPCSAATRTGVGWRRRPGTAAWISTRKTCRFPWGRTY